MNFNASDFNFGIIPNIDTLSGVGVSNPVGSYLRAAGPSGAIGANKSAVPGMSGGLGFNLDTAQLALGGLQTIGSLWQAWEANKLAKESFKFQKDFANTNLANSIQSYNTTLDDRIRSRGFTEGQSADQIQGYLDKNRLPTRTIG